MDPILIKRFVKYNKSLVAVIGATLLIVLFLLVIAVVKYLDMVEANNEVNKMRDNIRELQDPRKNKVAVIEGNRDLVKKDYDTYLRKNAEIRPFIGHPYRKALDAMAKVMNWKNGEQVCKEFYDFYAQNNRERVIDRYKRFKMSLNNGGPKNVGETVSFGYYSQDGLQFDEQKKVIDVVRDIAEEIDLGGGKKMSASQFLQHFLFTPETQYNYVYKLSGGEKRRLYLCTVLMQNPNFLVLDEPTNDLDIATMNVLEDYLCTFKGCVIVVSHDRYFMDKVVDHLLVFNGDAKIKDFPGNYTDYREWRELEEEEQREQAKQQEKKTAPKPVEVKERPRKITYKEKKELEALDIEIPQLEEEKVDVETQLSSGTLSAEEITSLSKRYEELTLLIDEKTMRWLELSEI